MTTCQWCQSPTVERKGKHGPFVGCSTFPKCRWSLSPVFLPGPTREDDRQRREDANYHMGLLFEDSYYSCPEEAEAACEWEESLRETSL